MHDFNLRRISLRVSGWLGIFRVNTHLSSVTNFCGIQSNIIVVGQPHTHVIFTDVTYRDIEFLEHNAATEASMPNYN